VEKKDDSVTPSSSQQKEENNNEVGVDHSDSNAVIVINNPYLCPAKLPAYVNFVKAITSS